METSAKSTSTGQAASEKGGCVVTITAAATGIGAVMARAFADAGHKVHISDKDPSALEKALQMNPDMTGSLVDVADPGDVARLMEDVQARCGRLDVLINNAGIAGPTAAVDEIEIDAWDHTLAVDLSGAFYVTRKAVPLLRESANASILFMSSNAGLFGFPYRLPYTVAKWGLIGMTKTLAMELGPAGIRVNALCPGSVNGERIEGVIERDAKQQSVDPETIRALYQRQSSLRCFVDADDIAAMALFLASDAGAKISGQAIAIDGHTESLSNTSD